MRLLILITALCVVVEVIHWPEFYNLLPYTRNEIDEYQSSQSTPDASLAESVPAGIQKIRSGAYWRGLVTQFLVDAIVSIFLLYVLIICISRKKSIVLYLRPFRVPFAHGIVTRALRSGLGRRYRIVTLDDLEFQPLEVPTAEVFLSRFGFLLGAGIGLVGLAILIGGLVGILFRIYVYGDINDVMTFLGRAIGVASLYLVIVLVFAPLSLIVLRRWVRRRSRFQIRTPEDLAGAVVRVPALGSIFQRPSFMAPQAVVIGTEEQMWRESVAALTGKVHALVVDISVIRPNLVWEIQKLASSGFTNCVFIAEEASLTQWLADGQHQELAESLAGHPVLVYRPGWRNRLRFRFSLENALDRVIAGPRRSVGFWHPRVHPIKAAVLVGGLAVLAFALFLLTGNEYAIQRTVQDGDYRAGNVFGSDSQHWMSALVSAGRVQEGLAFARRQGQPAIALSNAAIVLFKAGYRADADAVATEALHIARSEKEVSKYELSAIARALVACGRMDKALQLAREALKLSKDKDFDEDLVMVLVPYGTADEYKIMLSWADRDTRRSTFIDALLEANQIDTAIQFAHTITVMTLWDDPDQPYRDAAIIYIARALAVSGEFDRASELIFGLKDYVTGRSDAIVALASAAARQGQPERAQALLNSVIASGIAYSRSGEAETRALIAPALFRTGNRTGATAMVAEAKAAALSLSGDERVRSLSSVAFELANGGMTREATAIANEYFQFSGLFSTRAEPDWEDASKIAGMWAVLGRYDRARLAVQRSKWDSDELPALTEILQAYGRSKGNAPRNSAEKPRPIDPERSTSILRSTLPNTKAHPLRKSRPRKRAKRRR